MHPPKRSQLWRFVSIFEMLAGIVLLAVSYQMGRAHFSLIRDGARAPGKIIAYARLRASDGVGPTTGKYGSFDSKSSSSPMKAFVEYKVNGHIIHFTDWKDASSTAGLNQPVTVLYDPVHPGIAMIDRPFWNWMPWAPITALGALLIVAAIWTRLRERSQASSP